MSFYEEITLHIQKKEKPMNFLGTQIVLALLRAWAKGQGKKRLEALAADPRHDFRTDVPLSNKSLFAWTEDHELTKAQLKELKRKFGFTVTVDGKRFWFYWQIA